MAGKINAPFTPQQVAALHRYQFGPWDPGNRFHPFTCPNRGDGNHFDIDRDHGILIPTVRGWICQCCDHEQNWCHEFMIGGPQPGQNPYTALYSSDRK